MIRTLTSAPWICPYQRAGLPPTRTKAILNFSLIVKQFSLTLQDDYSGHKLTKIRMAQVIFKPKLSF